MTRGRKNRHRRARLRKMRDDAWSAYCAYTQRRYEAARNPTNDVDRARRKRLDARVAAFCKEHGLVREDTEPAHAQVPVTPTA